VVEDDDPAAGAARVTQFLAGGGRLVLYRNPANLGFAGGNNTALRLLGGFLGERGQFLVMNPDIAISNDTASRLLGHPAEICGPAVYEHYMKGVCRDLHSMDFSTGFASGRLDPAGKVTCITGCCFKISGAALLRYGFLPEENFLYEEEIKYFERVFHQGGAPVYVPELQIEHFGSESAGKNTFHYFYYLFRNRMNYFLEIAGPRYGCYARFAAHYLRWWFGVSYAHLKRRNWEGLHGIFRGVWDGLHRVKGPCQR
jgi:hypothetical protein